MKKTKSFEISYFRNNNIRIKNIFVNKWSSTVFWVTAGNKVHGQGLNHTRCQLGIVDKYDEKCPESTCFHFLKNHFLKIQSM